MKTLLRFSLLLFWGYSVFADEPGWTLEERKENRDAVIGGQVKSVVTIKKIDQYRELRSAEIEITAIVKKHPALNAKTVTVYFEGSLNGAVRCPSFAALSLGQDATLYLRYGEWLTGQAAFIVDMGSDIRPTR